MFLYRVRIVADQEESDKVKTNKARKKLELIEKAPRQLLFNIGFTL